MTIIKPFIDCVDYWPHEIPPEALAAYKALIDEGQILKRHVTYNKTTGSVLVKYQSNQPHEWVLQELSKRAREAS